ncbi:MAG: SDR family oxidoreductase [Candidatus Thiodiazotropha lotti]|nr:SDR family oxidoreductase [Candidatus Thiodiazotropha lotti]MCG7932387.1 SDR family oxidoreductase [Candidatus Thiodiazotropha lotti]MCG8001965.1 SDR family oxidoreductase [Candidatus Thiodiazotropha lotti]MCW4185583.1 SDR family oxidoreductase [Candidatus Thiodiazotropha lotti]MCW4199655.1 SDR family oxidoreductase [Candidatus Thiodiazotropha lotti]
MKKILVTGANGFVGTHLCPYLLDQGYSVRAALRSRQAAWQVGEQTVVGDISADSDWQQALQGVDSVIHLAGRAHVMRESTDDPLSLFRQVNVVGSLRLAEQAMVAGVRRFVYLSSIKVNGESSSAKPLAADDPAKPEDAYGQSKWEAEQALKDYLANGDMELVIVRPVLVYGAGVKGNLQSLVRWIRNGVPLPLAGVENRRSLVGIDNLLDFLQLCIEHPAAAGEAFLVADGEDLSTPRLIRMLAQAMGVKAKLFPLPNRVLRLLGRLSGRSAAIDRLCGDLQVDLDKNRRLLGWTPKQSVEAGLRDMIGGMD